MTRAELTFLEDPRPRIGLIVLRVDETVEDDMRRLIPREAARLHVARVASGDDLTPQSIAAMEAHLTNTAALLPPAADFAAVGYACTSATAALGAGPVHAAIRAGVSTRAVTDPLTATLAQLESIGARRLAVVSPYLPEVAASLAEAFAAAGVEVSGSVSFSEMSEARVARLAPELLIEAAVRLARDCHPEAIFLSCTNLRTLDVLEQISTVSGLPVLSSNVALAWHMRRLSGIDG